MYKLTYKKSALKALQKMPKTKALKMHQELTNMAQAPYTYKGDWKPMRGQPFWRLRQGSYRAICRIDNGELVVLVLKIGTRGDVYK